MLKRAEGIIASAFVLWWLLFAATVVVLTILDVWSRV